ncbi:hypothetical protein N136_01477 [Leifsonia aquatica ATCC 14665]|uniref:Uncharacterized protein n=1 Tax=Leifsonia aquatica ATCC 14665 TaxID=1358026 RepID=U2TBU5_LEIAQ|nr:hypothetical protein N136_01477 [Leifsonia aquatica ATCC 14665]
MIDAVEQASQSFLAHLDALESTIPHCEHRSPRSPASGRQGEHHG